jgi:hypothetical protein
MAEARRYVANMEHIDTNKLSLVLRLLQQLKNDNVLTREQEWMMPHIEAEMRKRNEQKTALDSD